MPTFAILLAGIGSQKCAIIQVMFERLKSRNFDLRFTTHAAAILEHEFLSAATEIEDALASLSIPIQSLVGSGGGVAAVTKNLRSEFDSRGWKKENFRITQEVNGVASVADSHEVDHVKKFPQGRVLLEIEWNNKDPFFDRDLSNYRSLHQAAAASIGVIITRGSSLQARAVQMLSRFFESEEITSFAQLERFGMKRATARQTERLRQEQSRGVCHAEALARVFVADKYGTATTHWDKLNERLERGLGRPCPMVLIGIPADVVTYPASLASIDTSLKIADTTKPGITNPA